MKILFFCGSLEFGCDGVGDYTRRLAGELIRQGHQASIIALNDRLIDKFISTKQEVDGITVPVLRLSATMSSKKRFACAGSYIEYFNPEWLSLQYVPFSFQEKGLPFGLGSQLVKIGKGRKWHVMFHELWVGIKEADTLKYRIWGWLQRNILTKLVCDLKPEVVHTQTPLYLSLLEKFGIRPHLLPLFSNIPNHLLSINDLEVNNKIERELVFLIFGSIHPCLSVEPFLKEISKFSENNSKRIIIKAIGRNGNEIDKWYIIAKRLGVELIIMGEQPVEVIAKELCFATIGVSTTALPMIQKSGTVAAMRECGMPVICLDSQMQPRKVIKPSTPEGVLIFNSGVIEECLKYKHNNHSFPGLEEVARIFNRDVSNL